MTAFFLDTSFLIALEASSDQNHESAKSYWQGILESPPQLVTTSYVFDEIVTLFNKRGQHARAVKIGDQMLSSPSVRFVHVDTALFFEGWRFCKQHADKSYSLTDCISFLVMKNLGLRTALTFDRHFEQAGFETLPTLKP